MKFNYSDYYTFSLYEKKITNFTRKLKNRQRSSIQRKYMPREARASYFTMRYIIYRYTLSATCGT